MSLNSGYQRIMVIGEPTPASEGIIRRGVALARFHQAALRLVLVVDYGMGMEEDHAPFLTPEERARQLTRHFREQLATLLGSLGLSRLDLVLATDPPERSMAKAALEWHADLVVITPVLARQVGTSSWFGLVPGLPMPCPMLVVPEETRSPHWLQWLGRWLPTP